MTQKFDQMNFQPIIHIEIDPSRKGRYKLKYERTHPHILHEDIIQINNYVMRKVTNYEISNEAQERRQSTQTSTTITRGELQCTLERLRKHQEIGNMNSQAILIRTIAEAYLEDLPSGETLSEIAFDILMKVIISIHTSLNFIDAEERRIIIQEVEMLNQSIRQATEIQETNEHNLIERDQRKLVVSVQRLATIMSNDAIICADLLPVVLAPIAITAKFDDEPNLVQNVKMFSTTTLQMLADEHDKVSDLKFDTKVETCVRHTEYQLRKGTESPMSQDQDQNWSTNDNELINHDSQQALPRPESDHDDQSSQIQTCDATEGIND